MHMKFVFPLFMVDSRGNRSIHTIFSNQDAAEIGKDIMEGKSGFTPFKWAIGKYAVHDSILDAMDAGKLKL